MKNHILTVASLALCLGTPLAAQTVLSGDHVIQGSLCAGATCPSSLSFGSVDLQIDDMSPILSFEDKSGAPFPNNDYAFFANPSSSSENSFTLQNLSTATDLLYLSGEVTSPGIHLAADGAFGLGTSLPQAELHIVAANTPSHRLEQSTSGGNPNYVWDIGGNNVSFFISDVTGGNTVPFRIEDGAPTNAMVIEGTTGDVGLGTNAPEGKLHTKGDGVQLTYFESGDGGPVQVRFRTDSQNRRFLAVNNANEVKSQIIFKDNEIQFTGATDSGANRWLTIGPAGIVSQGPTCNPGPCDRTFDRDFFTVPPIEDRAAMMWENRHLPGIGPTQPHAPINLTEKLGGVIHELEVAHIYIEELHKQNTTQNAELAAMVRENAALTDEVADMAERLAVLERLLAE